MDTHLKQIFSDIATQHEHLHKLVDDLHDCDHLHLIPLLEELTTLLDDHFMREEGAGGLYESVGAYSDEHEHEVKRLKQEHVLVSCACRGLLARAKLSPEANEPQLIQEIKDVLGCLGDHERRENNMVVGLLNSYGVTQIID